MFGSGFWGTETVGQTSARDGLDPGMATGEEDFDITNIPIYVTRLRNINVSTSYATLQIPQPK